jgi:hypothetical protein
MSSLIFRFRRIDVGSKRGIIEKHSYQTFYNKIMCKKTRHVKIVIIRNCNYSMKHIKREVAKHKSVLVVAQ